MSDEQMSYLDRLGSQFDERAAHDAVHRRDGVARRVATAPAGRAVLAAAAMTVLAAAVILPGVGGSHISLVDKAYADAAAPGIAHWRTTVRAYDGQRLLTTQEIEGWADGEVSHTITTATTAATVSRSERRVAGEKQTFRNGDGPVQSGPAGASDLERTLPGQDPFAAFKAAHDTGQLQQTDAVSFTVPAAGGPALTYTVDPDSGQPRTLTETEGSTRVVTSFNTYEHIADTPANQHDLELAGS